MNGRVEHRGAQRSRPRSSFLMHVCESFRT
jgi:hypothetical protein